MFCFMLVYLPKMEITLHTLTLKHLTAYTLKLKCRLRYFPLHVSLRNILYRYIRIRKQPCVFRHSLTVISSTSTYEQSTFCTTSEFNKTFSWYQPCQVVERRANQRLESRFCFRHRGWSGKSVVCCVMMCFEWNWKRRVCMSYCNPYKCISTKV